MDKFWYCVNWFVVVACTSLLVFIIVDITVLKDGDWLSLLGKLFWVPFLAIPAIRRIKSYREEHCDNAR